MPCSNRRALLLGGGALALAALLPRGSRAAILSSDLPADLPADIHFDVHVAGSKVGHHTLTFTQGPGADELTVRVDVRMRVRLFFVTVFDYTQQTEEVWRGDRLVRFTSTTLDGDNRDAVTAIQGLDGLDVESLRFGGRRLPADTWPSTAFWRLDAVGRTEFLDAARGDIRKVAIAEQEAEFIDARERRHLARRFHVDTSRDFDVWYSVTGAWLKLQWSGFGMTADYRRIA
ncbi:MAG: DUF6134 family protein [Minwuia sp.]|nr:DUF6134 family protein [Minwuia sp.]